LSSSGSSWRAHAQDNNRLSQVLVFELERRSASRFGSRLRLALHNQQDVLTTVLRDAKIEGDRTGIQRPQTVEGATASSVQMTRCARRGMTSWLRP